MSPPSLFFWKFPLRWLLVLLAIYHHGRTNIEVVFVQSFRCCSSGPTAEVRGRSPSRTLHLRTLLQSFPNNNQQQEIDPNPRQTTTTGPRGKDAILKQKLELLQPTRRQLQVRTGNYNNHNNLENDATASANTTQTIVLSVHQNRKPRGYWKTVSNIDQELRDQWLEAIGANADGRTQTSNDNTNMKILRSLLHPPPIPNEALLNHWNRHDLRHAIREFGGRDFLAKAMTEHHHQTNNQNHRSSFRSCYIIPGKWKEATGFGAPPDKRPPHPLVTSVIEHDPCLDPERAPISKGQKKRLRSKRYGMSEEDIQSWMANKGSSSSSNQQRRWSHVNNYKEYSPDNNSNTLRRRKRADHGTWSKETLCEVLRDYLCLRKRKRGIPSVWMPRLSEFELGFDDDQAITSSEQQQHSATSDNDERFGYLKNAIANTYGATHGSGFGRSMVERTRGVEKLCVDLGLVPSYEWKAFEGFHDLMVSLKEHIDNEHYKQHGDNEAFPDYGVFPKGYSTAWRTSTAGTKRLFYLVQRYGGRDLVAGRLGMARTKSEQHRIKATGELSYPCWGPFDLEFGISLMEYTKLDQLRREPLRQGQRGSRETNNNICMPTADQLLRKSPASPSSLLVFRKSSNDDCNDFHCGGGETWGEYLDSKIIHCGGYENVARRLGLEWLE